MNLFYETRTWYGHEMASKVMIRMSVLGMLYSDVRLIIQDSMFLDAIFYG